MVKEKKVPKPSSKYKGTSTLIKLPYIIGTKEYTEHKYAGLVYAGTGNDQVELFEEEKK